MTPKVTDQAKPEKNVTVWSLDVWGNQKDGFEVNDRSKQGEYKVPCDFGTWSDEQLVRWLKDYGFIRKGVHRSSLSFDGDDLTIYVEQSRDSYPLYQIEID